MSKTTAERAAIVVADVKSYVAKPNTANLEEFQKFVLATTGAKPTADFIAGVRAAGLYSRYQAAKRDGLLETITAPKPAAKRAPRSPKPAPKVEAQTGE